MTGQIEMKDAATVGIGGTALSFPWWGEFVALTIGANQLLLGIGGLAIVGLTVYNLWLKNKALRQDISDHDQK